MGAGGREGLTALWRRVSDEVARDGPYANIELLHIQDLLRGMGALLAEVERLRADQAGARRAGRAGIWEIKLDEYRTLSAYTMPEGEVGRVVVLDLEVPSPEEVGEDVFATVDLTADQAYSLACELSALAARVERGY